MGCWRRLQLLSPLPVLLCAVLGSASSGDRMGYADDTLAPGCRMKDMSVLSTLWIREHPIKLR